MLPVLHELQDDKSNKLICAPTAQQIRSDWSESSLCTRWVAKDPRFLHVDSKDSDETGRMARLIWVFAGSTSHFVMFWLTCPGNSTNRSIEDAENKRKRFTWVSSWQNQQNDCAPSEDSDQHGHLPSLIRVFAIGMEVAWTFSHTVSAQRRRWSDCADAQADLSHRWAHSHFVGFVMLWFTYDCYLFLLLFISWIQISSHLKKTILWVNSVSTIQCWLEFCQGCFVRRGFGSEWTTFFFFLNVDLHGHSPSYSLGNTLWKIAIPSQQNASIEKRSESHWSVIPYRHRIQCTVRQLKYPFSSI